MDMEFCSVLAMVQAVVIAPRAEASARRALAPRRAKRSNPLYKECRGDRPVAPTSAAIAVLPVRCTQTGSQCSYATHGTNASPLTPKKSHRVFFAF
jgi:hypothetical protein